MKTLHLVLTGHWYDEIEAGRKRVEYRRLCDHWITRVLKTKEPWDYVIFHRAYTKTTLIFKVTKINITAAAEQIEIYFEDVPAWGGDPTDPGWEKMDPVFIK